MTIKKFVTNGAAALSYYLVGRHLCGVSKRILSIQTGVFLSSFALKEAIKPQELKGELTEYEIIPLLCSAASIYWTGVSKKAQGIATLILCGTSLMFEEEPKQTRSAPSTVTYSKPRPEKITNKEPLNFPEPVKIGGTTIRVVAGDILDQHVVAIVNAANEMLMGGGGIDSAIHYAAGAYNLHQACGEYLAKIDRKQIFAGEAMITGSFNISDRTRSIQKIMHAVGPRDKNPKELANAYINSLKIAQQNKIRTIAFPAIAVGIFGYPFGNAQNVAYQAVKEYLEKYPNAFDTILFVYLEDEVRKKGWASKIQRAWDQHLNLVKSSKEKV